MKTPNVCQHCGKIIVLKKNGLHYKWFSARGKKTETWKCGNDPDFPVRTHSPKTETAYNYAADDFNFDADREDRYFGRK